MQELKQKITLFGEEVEATLLQFDEKDSPAWREAFKAWLVLKKHMQNMCARQPNIPEGLSEIAFCIKTGSCRIDNSSADTYNLKTKRAEQIKASSIEYDLTSFGPNSKWDDLYFLDFYNKNDIDGTFDIYLVPTTKIYSMILNQKNQKTFADYQKDGKRPRLSLKKSILEADKVKPIHAKVQI